MNELINKFLLAGNKFMPEMHLRKPGFIYSACELFTKSKERIKKLKKKTGDLTQLCIVHIYGKYAWVVPLKEQKGITVNKVF